MSRANKNHPYDQQEHNGSSNSLRLASAVILNTVRPMVNNGGTHRPDSSSTPPPTPTDITLRASSSRLHTFVRKYFLAGQHLDSRYNREEKRGCACDVLLPASKPPFYERHRKLIAFAVPFFISQAVWWTLAIRYNLFRLFATRWEMVVTMMFGAVVAGATSEGGGAIAFPVMTLLLHINPIVARDYSLMIQSCGMTAASFMIIWMRLQVEWHSVWITSAGAAIGMILGLNFVDEVLTAQVKKMLFVSIWFAFGVSLFLLNRQRKRVTHLTIPNFCAWKAGVLLATGLFGGLCTAFAGSGVDICSFSVLTLLFRVATPTSVLLMATNSLVGFYWRQLIITGVSPLALEYLAVTAPVGVLFAPLGAFASSHFHRQVLATFIYVLEALAVVGFLATSPPWPLMVIGASIIVFSALLFLGISQLGMWVERRETAALQATGVLEEERSQASIAVIVAEKLSEGVDGRVRVATNR